MAIITVMGNMGTHKGSYTLYKTVKICVLIFGWGLGFHSHNVFAFDWRLRPNLSMSEIFSDNLNLSENAKKSGFVTEISPGLALSGQSPWSSFNLNYRLQGLYNAGGRDAVDINHQLQMNSLYQAVRNTLFLQTSSSISQQNLSNSFIATDNISGSGSRTETKNFSISPYWTPHFAQYGSGLFKVGYNRVSFDNTNTSQVSPLFSNLISDSQTYTKQARLSSGSYFNRVNWNLNYSSQDQNRDGGGDVRFENYMADGRYFINHQYNVFAQAGYENNDYQTLSNNINNGFFYTVGAQWRPSLWYSLEVGVGNNKHVTVQFNPSANLTSNITYRNKDVGLNSGSSWDANFNYRAAQANWGFKYFQDTTTVQQVLIEQGIFTLDPNDPTGRTVIRATDATPQAQLFIINLPNLVNDVLVRKRGDLTFSYQTGKSSYNASLYNERRTYQLSASEDTIYGATGGWQWQFAPRLNFFLQPIWQSTNGITSNERYDVALGLSRSIPINLGRPSLMNTKVEFRHIEQVSETAGLGYTENRATANFFVQF